MICEIGMWLLNTVQSCFPLVNAENVLNLDFPTNSTIEWVVANTLEFIWRNRSSRKKVGLTSCLGYLKFEAMKLEETRHSQLAARIQEILGNTEWTLRMKRLYFLRKQHPRQHLCLILIFSLSGNNTIDNICVWALILSFVSSGNYSIVTDCS